jgi:hypothetical protein
VTVKMTSDFSVTRGVTNTLTADSTDVLRFDSDGSQLRITFKGGVNEATLTGFVPKRDLDDKEKYWSTPELIKQIEGWVKHLEQMTKQYAQNGGSNYTYANNYHQQATALRSLLLDLREGDEIWTD